MTKSLTGGARIGWFNTPYFFATLTATPDSLTLKTRIFGTYTFTPSQVISISAQYGWLIPFIGQGVWIEHAVAAYPRQIVFWCLDPKTVLAWITSAGFIPSTSPPSVLKTCSFCGVQTIGDSPKCARCGQPFQTSSPHS